MMQDVYKAPEAELIGPQNMTDASEFFVVSIRKLWIMNLLTIGSYGLVWHYQHWKQFRDSISDRDIWPVPRAIFTIFFVHALFGLIQDSSQQKGGSPWNANLLATLYILVAIFSSVLGYLPIDSFLSTPDAAAILYVVNLVLAVLANTYFLTKAQAHANFACDDVEGIANSKITWLNMIWIIIFGLYLLAMLIGIFLGSSILSGA